MYAEALSWCLQVVESEWFIQLYGSFDLARIMLWFSRVEVYLPLKRRKLRPIEWASRQETEA